MIAEPVVDLSEAVQIYHDDVVLRGCGYLVGDDCHVFLKLELIRNAGNHVHTHPVPVTPQLALQCVYQTRGVMKLLTFPPQDYSERKKQKQEDNERAEAGDRDEVSRH